MTDPVKAIQTVKHRLARLAAMQTLTALLPPALVLAGAALGLRTLGFHTWERLGFMLSRRSESDLQAGLLAAAALGVIASAVIAWFSFRRSNDSIQAAEQIDRKLGCREEVLTLATMAEDGASSLRSPLFPVLWRRAAEYLDKLDPIRRVFPFQRRTAAKAGLVPERLYNGSAGDGNHCFARRQPSAAGRRGRGRFASWRGRSPTAARTRKPATLADKLQAVADMLEDPKVPPEIKLEQLASAERELKAQQERRQQQRQQDAAGKSEQARPRAIRVRAPARVKKDRVRVRKAPARVRKVRQDGSGKGSGQGADSGTGERREGRKSARASAQGHLEGPGATGSGSRQAQLRASARTPAAKRDGRPDPVSARHGQPRKREESPRPGPHQGGQ